MWLALIVACGGSTVEVGEFTVDLDRKRGVLQVSHARYAGRLDDLRFVAGDGDAAVEMQFGSFRFDDVTATLRDARYGKPHRRFRPVVVEVSDENGDALGMLAIDEVDDGVLLLDFVADNGDRVGFSAACDDDDHFLGFGSHAQDVDHVGEAFPLWVSEPGIGKTDDDELPDDWFLTGTKHASSWPMPWTVRPQQAQGLLLDVDARVEVDLCATDPSRFSALAWTRELPLLVVLADTPLSVVRKLPALHGDAPTLPPPWVFAPWNDAIRGQDRVRAVAARLRAFDAPASAIWTEDWKGGEETAQGYHLTNDWTLDRELYPDAEAVAAELEADGFAWLAYFSTFVAEDSDVWADAVAADALIETEAGDVYTFTGVSFEPTSLVDLSGSAGPDWMRQLMDDTLAIGFDGWMADYGEWLPTDARLDSGADALSAHQAYPVWWQALNEDVLAGHDATFFSRSGWAGAAGIAPVAWAGDQRTSFDPDDGYPTVLALGLGLSIGGVPVYSHDVGGYQSVGNPGTTKELWFRWASLGAFTPVMRTHHGAFDTGNWQFDSDDETTEHWARYAREHTRLFPYLYGLAARAVAEGTPIVLPVAFRYGEDWDRTDAWLLGDALLVAPVLEEGATSRHVELPDEVGWYDWWTRAPASTGEVASPVDHIPVFAAAGTTVPTFVEAPDTLRDATNPDLTTYEDADAARVVYLFGGGGPFTEADGTTYTPSGAPTGYAEATATLDRGTIEAGGVSLAIEGPSSRTYTVVVVP